MKTIETLTSPELWKLEKAFETPSTLTETIMLRGIQAELKERDDEPERQYEKEIEELEDKLSATESDLEEVRSELSDERREMERQKASRADLDKKVEALVA